MTTNVYNVRHQQLVKQRMIRSTDVLQSYLRLDPILLVEFMLSLEQHVRSNN